MNRVIFENEYVEVKKCKWGYLSYNKFDMYIGKSLKMYGEWCEPELDLLGKYTNQDDTILDVGANIGSHTIFFAKKAFRGMVIAFEPQRLSFQMLCTNVTLNALTNVHTHQIALGDYKGLISVPLISPYSKFNFGGLRLENYIEGEQTPLLEIDSMDFNRVNLIKLDVERMEVKVLKGAQRTIKKFRPILYIENNSISESPEIMEILYSLDYKCWWHIASYFNKNNYFKNKKNVFSTSYPEANMLCIHKSFKSIPPNLIEIAGKNDSWINATERLLKIHNGMGLNFTEQEYSIMKF